MYFNTKILIIHKYTDAPNFSTSTGNLGGSAVFSDLFAVEAAGGAELDDKNYN